MPDFMNRLCRGKDFVSGVLLPKRKKGGQIKLCTILQDLCSGVQDLCSGVQDLCSGVQDSFNFDAGSIGIT